MFERIKFKVLEKNFCLRNLCALDIITISSG